MAVRKIACTACDRHLGEIRDATLRKGAGHLCALCDEKIRAARSASGQEPFWQFMHEVFRKKEISSEIKG